MKSIDKFAVILVRVSTAIQDYEPQKQDLIKFAESKGFNNFHFIETKESGLADLKNKEGFEHLVNFISDNPKFRTVFATELSRIARRQSILHEIREWFCKHKIQLHLKDTGYSLLNDDGTVSLSGEIMFTLFGYFAESEVKTKKERFKRSKELLVSEGYSISGKRLFGYEREMDPIRKKNKYVINEKESNEIRKLFTWYAKGIENENKDPSISVLRNYCIRLNFSKYTHSKRNLNKLLKEEAYTGQKITNNQRKNPNFVDENNEEKYIVTQNKISYPQIITPELFEHVQNRMKEKNTRCDKSNKHITILSKLLICKNCKRYFQGQYRFNNDGKSLCSYRCSYTRSVRTCENTSSISMRLLDSTIWSYIKSDIPAIWSYVVTLNNDFDKLEKEIENLTSEKLKIKNELESLNKKYLRIVKVEDSTFEDEEYYSLATMYKNRIVEVSKLENQLKERQLLEKKELNENLDKKVIKDIDEIEKSKLRLKDVVNRLIRKIELLFQNKRFSVIKIHLESNSTTTNVSSKPGFYSFVIIDKFETRNIKLLKLMDVFDFHDDFFTFNNHTFKIDEFLNLTLESKRKFSKIFKMENPDKYYFKEIPYVRLELFDKQDYLLQQ
jgi:DNA invertase Pin-like site-specific DNA recombinase